MRNLHLHTETDVWSYYNFLQIQAFMLPDTLFVILTNPLVDKSFTFHLCKRHNF